MMNKLNGASLIRGRQSRRLLHLKVHQRCDSCREKPLDRKSGCKAGKGGKEGEEEHCANSGDVVGVFTDKLLMFVCSGRDLIWIGVT